MMKVKVFATLIALALSSSLAIAGEVIYRWTDAQGVVKYTETKPPAGVKYVMIRDRSSSEVQGDQSTAEDGKETAAEPLNNQQQMNKINQERKAKNCTIAKSNLAGLKKTTRIQVEEEGKKRLLSDKERNQRLAQAEENISKFCE